jgi:hypothetical protein
LYLRGRGRGLDNNGRHFHRPIEPRNLTRGFHTRQLSCVQFPFPFLDPCPTRVHAGSQAGRADGCSSPPRCPARLCTVGTFRISLATRQGALIYRQGARKCLRLYVPRMMPGCPSKDFTFIAAARPTLARLRARKATPVYLLLSRTTVGSSGCRPAVTRSRTISTALPCRPR